jgi:DNA-binding beta-propeller fold protein YncE
VLLAIPLALLALAPFTGRAAAHPAAPARAARAAAPTVGKSSGPAMDITLHIHGFVYGLTTPYRMGTDAQGNLFVSDIGTYRVNMYDANDAFVRYLGTGTMGGGGGNFGAPEGIAANATTVFVVDNINHEIQTFTKNTGAYVSQFGGGNLSSPYGIALGTNGNLYVADNFLNEVVEFSTTGTFLGSFGTGGSGPGQFSGLHGIAASPFGLLYVTDSGNNRVQQFKLDGTYLAQWGHFGFTFPDGIAVDRAGMVYVVDRTALIIYKFDAGGSFVGAYAAPTTTPFTPGTFQDPGDVAVRGIANTPISVYVSDLAAGSGVLERFDQVINPQFHSYQSQWGSAGSGTSQFDGPFGIVADLAGNIFVTDEHNNRVQKFDQFGNFLLAFGTAGSGNGQFNFPAGIAITPDGATLYIADFGNSRIEKFDTSGNYLGQFGGPGSGNGQFSGPLAVATDGNFVYVADTLNNRIQALFFDGTYVAQWGTLGSGPTNFHLPAGIALDTVRSELYIADYDNNRVQVYTTGGVLITSITTVGSGAFSGPEGVFTDQRGDVYVADTNNARIYQMDVNTTRWTVFGTPGTGDGQFDHPWDLAVSPTNGQLYILDNGNNRVQRWGSAWPKYDTIGVYRPSAKTFYLRNHNTTGPADISVYMPYALPGDLPVVGDWEGTGVDTVGLYRPSTARFILQDANAQESAPDYTFTLGVAGDTPIAGNWDGQGRDGAGIFRPSNGILYLKNKLSTGVADYNLVLGVPGDKGIAGDWNGDGQDSPGVYRPSNERFYVTNKVTNGVVTSDHSAVLGISGDVPFTGDWIAQGFSGIGVFRPSNGVTYEKNTIVTGPADNNFIYGIAGDIPVAGQWIALQIPFSAPPPHIALGTRGSASHAASGTPVPGRPGGMPAHTPAAAATPSTPRHKAPGAR